MATNKPRVTIPIDPKVLDRIQKVMDVEPVYENNRSVFIRHAISQHLLLFEKRHSLNEKRKESVAA